LPAPQHRLAQGALLGGRRANRPDDNNGMTLVIIRRITEVATPRGRARLCDFD